MEGMYHTPLEHVEIYFLGGHFGIIVCIIKNLKNETDI